MAKELDLEDGIIYITDQRNMVQIMQRNISLNKTISRIEASELDWSHPLPFTIYNTSADLIQGRTDPLPFV